MNTSAKIREFLRLLLGALLALICSGDAQGDLETLWRCREKFASLDRRIPVVDYSALASRSGRYAGAEAILAKQKRDLSPEQYEAFEKWYFDHFFSDRWEALADSADSSAVELQPTTRYAKDGQDPLNGYRAARNYLWAIPLETMTTDTFARTQEHLLSWRSTSQARKGMFGWLGANNSENTESRDLGRVRERTVTFPAPKKTLFSMEPDPKTLHDINPYLFHREGVGTFEKDAVYYLPLSEWREFSDQLSPDLIVKITNAERSENAFSPERLIRERKLLEERMVKEEDHERWLAEMAATKLRRSNKLTNPQFEDRLKENERTLRNKYIDIRRTERAKLEYRRRYFDNTDVRYISALRVEFIQEMLSRRWKTLREELVPARTEGAVVAAIGSFHYDFISMHPFINGNGRTGRLITERLLAEYGLPPPIWQRFGEDVALRKKDFLKLFVEALAISKEFHRDLGAVLENKIPHTAVGLGFLGPIVSRELAGEHPVDALEYLTWIAAGRSHFLNVKSSLNGYETWRQRANERNIHLANPLFVNSFGKLSPNDAIYQTKLQTDYTEALGYLVIRSKKPETDVSLLGHFSNPQPGINAEKALNDFNRTVLREFESTQSWLEKPWWGESNAKKAGVVPLHSTSHASLAQTEGTGRNLVLVEARLRKIGTLTLDKIHFQAGGVDPEAVQRIRAMNGKNRTSVAQRDAFNRVSIEDFENDERVARRTYELSSDGVWFQTGLSR